MKSIYLYQAIRKYPQNFFGYISKFGGACIHAFLITGLFSLENHLDIQEMKIEAREDKQKIEIPECVLTIETGWKGSIPKNLRYDIFSWLRSKRLLGANKTLDIYTLRIVALASEKCSVTMFSEYEVLKQSYFEGVPGELLRVARFRDEQPYLGMDFVISTQIFDNKFVDANKLYKLLKEFPYAGETSLLEEVDISIDVISKTEFDLTCHKKNSSFPYRTL